MNPNIPQKGLYLKDSHLIASGDKGAFATPAPSSLQGQRALLVKEHDTCVIPGTVTISEPEPLDPNSFDQKQSIHGISRSDRLSWWPEAETLYLHRLSFQPFDKPITLDFPACIGTDVDMAKILPVRAKAIIIDKSPTETGYRYTIGIIGED
jgi:hypothetical protein